jgi:CBS domain-containing protein
MTSPVVAIAAEANVWVAMETFGAAGTRHLVVIETDGSCSGILTHHHIAALWPMDPLGLQDHRVGTIIDRDFAAVPPDATVAEAAATMLRHGVDAVAVLDPTGRVLGVLTGGDIVRLVASVNVDAPTSQRIPVD